MKRTTLGALVVVAIALSAGLGTYAATTGDDDEPSGGGTPVGLIKCREDDPDCIARIGGRESDTGGAPASAGGGAAAGSCLVGTSCEDTPETPTKPKESDPGTTTSSPSPSLGVCAPDTPDCVDTEVTTPSGGEE